MPRGPRAPLPPPPPMALPRLPETPTSPRITPLPDSKLSSSAISVQLRSPSSTPSSPPIAALGGLALGGNLLSAAQPGHGLDLGLPATSLARRRPGLVPESPTMKTFKELASGIRTNAKFGRLVVYSAECAGRLANNDTSVEELVNSGCLTALFHALSMNPNNRELLGTVNGVILRAASKHPNYAPLASCVASHANILAHALKSHSGDTLKSTLAVIQTFTRPKSMNLSQTGVNDSVLESYHTAGVWEAVSDLLEMRLQAEKIGDYVDEEEMNALVEALATSSTNPKVSSLLVTRTELFRSILARAEANTGNAALVQAVSTLIATSALTMTSSIPEASSEEPQHQRDILVQLKVKDFLVKAAHLYPHNQRILACASQVLRQLASPQDVIKTVNALVTYLPQTSTLTPTLYTEEQVQHASNVLASLSGLLLVDKHASAFLTANGPLATYDLLKRILAEDGTRLPGTNIMGLSPSQLSAISATSAALSRAAGHPTLSDRAKEGRVYAMVTGKAPKAVLASVVKLSSDAQELVGAAVAAGGLTASVEITEALSARAAAFASTTNVLTGLIPSAKYIPFFIKNDVLPATARSAAAFISVMGPMLGVSDDVSNLAESAISLASTIAVRCPPDGAAGREALSALRSVAPCLVAVLHAAMESSDPRAIEIVSRALVSATYIMKAGIIEGNGVCQGMNAFIEAGGIAGVVGLLQHPILSGDSYATSVAIDAVISLCCDEGARELMGNFGVGGMVKKLISQFENHDLIQKRGGVALLALKGDPQTVTSLLSSGTTTNPPTTSTSLTGSVSPLKVESSDESGLGQIQVEIPFEVVARPGTSMTADMSQRIMLGYANDDDDNAGVILEVTDAKTGQEGMGSQGNRSRNNGPRTKLNRGFKISDELSTLAQAASQLIGNLLDFHSDKLAKAEEGGVPAALVRVNDHVSQLEVSRLVSLFDTLLTQPVSRDRQLLLGAIIDAIITIHEGETDPSSPLYTIARHKTAHGYEGAPTELAKALITYRVAERLACVAEAEAKRGIEGKVEYEELLAFFGEGDDYSNDGSEDDDNSGEGGNDGSRLSNIGPNSEQSSEISGNNTTDKYKLDLQSKYATTAERVLDLALSAPTPLLSDIVHACGKIPKYRDEMMRYKRRYTSHGNKAEMMARIQARQSVFIAGAETMLSLSAAIYAEICMSKTMDEEALRRAEEERKRNVENIKLLQEESFERHQEKRRQENDEKLQAAIRKQKELREEMEREIKRAEVERRKQFELARLTLIAEQTQALTDAVKAKQSGLEHIQRDTNNRGNINNKDEHGKVLDVLPPATRAFLSTGGLLTKHGRSGRSQIRHVLLTTVDGSECLAWKIPKTIEIKKNQRMKLNKYNDLGTGRCIPELMGIAGIGTGALGKDSGVDVCTSTQYESNYNNNLTEQKDVNHNSNNNNTGRNDGATGTVGNTSRPELGSACFVIYGYDADDEDRQVAFEASTPEAAKQW